MTAPLDISVIVGELAKRAASLCADLLPAGVKEGSEWRVGSVAGEPGRSMAVHLSGARAGVWCDFGGRPDDRGDALDLIAQVKFRGDKGKAVAWSRAWLGIDSVDPKSFAERRRTVERRARQADYDETQRRRKFALGIFFGAAAKIAGTPAERYLLARGIDFARLGRQPSCLRYAKELVDPDGCVWPGLVAAISGPDGAICAVHRTFLSAQANGRVTKAPIEEPKLTLGRYAGGAIRLWRGASGKPLKDAPGGEWVMIGEGIEDVATAVMHNPQYRALVAVSLANMGGLVLPPAIAGVIILAQNDPELNKLGQRHPAHLAIERAIENFSAQGKRVKLWRPPPAFKDINELATQGGNAA